jgi:hypothetical protein
LISTYSYGAEQRCNTGYWWRKLGERDHLEGLRVDGGDNIKINLQKVEFGRSYLDLTGSGQGQVVGFCECGIEP